MSVRTRVWEKTKKTSGKEGWTPGPSSLELPLWGAIPNILGVFEAGAISKPVNSCSDSSGSKGISIS